jgi:hypothetical protein
LSEVIRRLEVCYTAYVLSEVIRRLEVCYTAYILSVGIRLLEVCYTAYVLSEVISSEDLETKKDYHLFVAHVETFR